MAENVAWLKPGTALPSFSDIDLDLFNQWHPSVMAEWQQEAGRDQKSKDYLASIGGSNFEGYLPWWLQTYGQGSGIGVPLRQATSPTAPTSPGTPTNTTPDNNANDLQGLIDQLLGGFNQQVRDAEAATGNRNDARAQVEAAFGHSYDRFSPNLLKPTVDQILGGQYQTTADMLAKAKARGMVNETGYGAGLGKLGMQKTGAEARLSQTVNDILSGYRSKYDTIRNEALNFASTSPAKGPLDLTSYLKRATDLENEAKTFGGGTLLNQLGNTQLFDFGSIRNQAGQAQGALNLKNLDIMDALAKRKAVSSVGRGLGSQGTF